MFKVYFIIFGMYVIIDLALYDINQTINTILNIGYWVFFLTLIVLIITFIKNKFIKNKETIKENTQKENSKSIKSFCANNMKLISVEQPKIYKKRQFLTESEKQFLLKLKDIYKEQYTIQAQIPLRMIIEKDTDNWKYANELNRYIDFGILDENEDIIALIELQDSTHHQKDRIIRDNKVRDICRQAQIPLVEIWNKNIPNEELKQIINKEIS